MQGSDARTVLCPLCRSLGEALPPESALPADFGEKVFVDCLMGDDTNSGSTPGTALKTIEAALKTTTVDWIEVSGGICSLQKPVLINRKTVLHGDGKTALSGGEIIKGWQPSGEGHLMVADVADDFPLKEIKMLRLGNISLSRSRWPKKVGDGLSTPNFLFTMPWSRGTADPNGGLSLQHLGIDPTKLPPRANLTALIGTGFLHVLGCIERDVNSQLTKILSIGGNGTEPTAGINFRNSFVTNQRYYFENVPWDLLQGEFYHDETAKKLYAWPPVSHAAELRSQGAVAPVTDQLLEIQGSGTVVSNLTFLDTTYYADGFWDGPAQQPSDAAIRINYANNVKIEACQFLSSVGGYGVAVGNATAGSSVMGSLFDHTGQGGVILYGYDSNPRNATGGVVPGNNTKPDQIEIGYNVMSDLGQTLVHVAGVGIRAGNSNHVHHNRISGSPRYGIQVDSFYAGTNGNPGVNSRFNLIELNIISDTCRMTSDCGAVEMLGSGDPANDGPSPGWYTGNTLRWNNISGTVGSSSSDGKTVCVHGQPAGPSCRNLVWGVDLSSPLSTLTL